LKLIVGSPRLFGTSIPSQIEVIGITALSGWIVRCSRRRKPALRLENPGQIPVTGSDVAAGNPSLRSARKTWSTRMTTELDLSAAMSRDLTEPLSLAQKESLQRAVAKVVCIARTSRSQRRSDD
jgi:hypothetical protein